MHSQSKPVEFRGLGGPSFERQFSDNTLAKKIVSKETCLERPPMENTQSREITTKAIAKKRMII